MSYLRNDRCTVYMGNLPSEADEDLMFELAIQFGPVQRLTLPKDRLTGIREDYCFIEYATPADAKYCNDVLTSSPIDLCGKRIRVSYKGDDALVADALLEIGAKLCVRNVDQAVDEVALMEHFKQFGNFAVPPKLLRDENGLSRGVAFISYESFESSDAALAATNNSWLFNRIISVDYADKPDGSGKHGSIEERRLYADATARVEADNAVFAGKAATTTATTKAEPGAFQQYEEAPSWAQGLNPYAASRR
jgi:splicing factor 3B subunit 4